MGKQKEQKGGRVQNEQEKQRIQEEREKHFIAFLDEHLSKCSLTLGAAAKANGLNASRASLIVRERTGLTYTEYVKRRRLELALAYKDQNPTAALSELVRVSGFASPKAFQKAYREKFGVPFSSEPDENQEEKRSLQEMREYILSHPSEDLSLKALNCRFFPDGIPSRLYRKFQEEFGVTLRQFVSAVRGEKFRECLKKGESVESAAGKAGLSPAAAKRLLLAQEGMTPTQYKKQYRQQLSAEVDHLVSEAITSGKPQPQIAAAAKNHIASSNPGKSLIVPVYRKIDEELIEQVIDFLQYSVRDGLINTRDLCRMFQVSYKRFSNAFIKATGKTLQDYQREVLMKKILDYCSCGSQEETAESICQFFNLDIRTFRRLYLAETGIPFSCRARKKTGSSQKAEPKPYIDFQDFEVLVSLLQPEDAAFLFALYEGIAPSRDSVKELIDLSWDSFQEDSVSLSTGRVIAVRPLFLKYAQAATALESPGGRFFSKLQLLQDASPSDAWTRVRWIYGKTIQQLGISQISMRELRRSGLFDWAKMFLRKFQNADAFLQSDEFLLCLEKYSENFQKDLASFARHYYNRNW